MQRTKIEWVKNPDGTQGYTINPIKGICLQGCPYCYAKRMYKRFKWDENINCNYGVFNEVEKIKEPSRIFVGSTHDIFGDWICYTWIANIIKYCSDSPQHTFIFLTKNPSRYKEFIFPDNCWLGTSIENNKNLGRLYDLVISTKKKNKIFVSFEPLLTEMRDIEYYQTELEFINWAIIGGLTPKRQHKDIWALNLIRYLRQFKIPIFLKDNLKWTEIIKEFPEVKI